MLRRRTPLSLALAVGALTAALLGGCSAPVHHGPVFSSVRQLTGSSAVIAHVRVDELLDEGIVDVRVVEQVPVEDGIDAPAGTRLVMSQPDDAPDLLNHQDYLLFLRPTTAGVYHVTGGAQGMWLAPKDAGGVDSGIVFEHADPDSRLPRHLTVDELRH